MVLYLVDIEFCFEAFMVGIKIHMDVMIRRLGEWNNRVPYSTNGVGFS